MKEKDFVSNYGLFSTIVVTVIGVGVFTLPSRMANEVGTDSWIVTIICGVIVYWLLYFLYKTIKVNNYSTFYEMLEKNLGKTLAKVIGLLFSAYGIFSIAIGMRVFAEVVKMFLLEKTPTEFILIAMIFTGTYLVRGELSALVKFNEISVWIMFVPIIIAFMFTTRGADFTNIFPILTHKPGQYMSGIINGVYAFAGFEIAYLVMPYMKNKKDINKALKKSIIFITFFYTLVVVLCLAFFAKEHTAELIWPTITLIRAIQIQGAFIERWEGVVMSLWVVFYFTTFVNFYYFSSDIVKNVFKVDDVKISSLICIPFLYGLALYPQNIAEVYDFAGKITPLFAIFTFILLPLVLFITGKLRLRREAANEES